MRYLTNYSIKITLGLVTVDIDSQADRKKEKVPALKLKYPVDTGFTETESINRILGLPGIKFRKYLSITNFFTG